MDLYRNVLFSFLFIPFDSRQTDVYRWGISGLNTKFSSELNNFVQTGPGALPASCKMGTGSFPGVKYGRDVTLTTHPLLVSR